MAASALSISYGEFALQRELAPIRPNVRSADHLHVGSFPATQDAQGSESMSYRASGPKLQRQTARVLSEDEVREQVASAVERLGNVKAVARLADTTPPAVENWRKRRNTMSLTTFATLCRNSPAFKAAARKLLDMEAALDPATEQALVELQQHLARTLEAGR